MYILMYFLYCVYGGKSNALIIAYILGFCNLFIMSLTILTLASPNPYNFVLILGVKLNRRQKVVQIWFHP
jgi:hypothetical protein